MGAYEGLSNCLDEPLRNYALSFGYDESNILILNGEIDKLKNDFPNIYQNLLSCRHHSDRRTPLEYGQDLVASWIFEDLFIQKMRENNLDIQLSGADRTRLILPDQRTSAASDYLIRTNSGKEITMELVNDYTGFWCRTHKLHLRDNKYLQLQRNHNLLLAIALSPHAQKFTLFDFRQDIPAKKISSHPPYGGKPAYELSVAADSLYDFSFPKVKETILHAIGDFKLWNKETDPQDGNTPSYQATLTKPK